MDDDKILEITGNIEKTLGDEAYATISDSIGELLTGNTENMKAIAEKNAEIDKLKDRNEKLVSANGALLQKIPRGKAVAVGEEFDKVFALTENGVHIPVHFYSCNFFSTVFH